MTWEVVKNMEESCCWFGISVAAYRCHHFPIFYGVVFCWKSFFLSCCRYKSWLREVVATRLSPGQIKYNSGILFSVAVPRVICGACASCFWGRSLHTVFNQFRYKQGLLMNQTTVLVYKGKWPNIGKTGCASNRTCYTYILEYAVQRHNKIWLDCRVSGSVTYRCTQVEIQVNLPK